MLQLSYISIWWYFVKNYMCYATKLLSVAYSPSGILKLLKSDSFTCVKEIFECFIFQWLYENTGNKL